MAVADDIMIYGVGDTVEEATQDHGRKLIAPMERCRKKNLKLNKEKLKLRQSSVPYIGHTITADRLKIDETKVEAIRKMPRPEDKKGVLRLLGMVNYVREFIQNMSYLTEPIRVLTKTEVEFAWNHEQEKCFEEIKKVLTEAPVLSF